MRFSDWICKNTKDDFFVGLVGYTAGVFDEEKAKSIIVNMFNDVEEMLKTSNGSHKRPVLVSGYSNLGILKIGYEEATKRGWKTVGCAPKEVLNYDIYDVDEKWIVGDNFGDESEYFISHIDIFIGIGNGKQTMKESEMAKERKIPMFMFELDRK